MPNETNKKKNEIIIKTIQKLQHIQINFNFNWRLLILFNYDNSFQFIYIKSLAGATTNYKNLFQL